MRAPLLLLVNGNSREDLTERMHTLAQARLGDLAQVEAITITSAPPFISNAKQSAKAAPEIQSAVLARILDPSKTRPDAVMIACFGEPGLWALRDSLAVPVTGMAESSGAAAMQMGRRFSILVSGQEWPDAIAELLAVYGMETRCSRITAVPDAALSDDPSIWQPALQEAVTQDAARGGTEVMILGGGPLAGRARVLRPPLGVRLLDAFDTTLMQTLALSLTTKATEGTT